MQDAKIKLVVERWVVQLDSSHSALRIWDFSGVQVWLDRFAKCFAFYLVRIMMECINWHLGSRDLAKYHSRYGKRLWCGVGCNNIKNNIWDLLFWIYDVLLVWIHWLVYCSNESASVIVISSYYWLSSFSCKFSMQKWIN